MRKSWKIGLLSLLVLLIVLQFIRPEKNLGSIEGLSAFEDSLNMPREIAGLLESSCYDCHSDRTSYPWYSNVAPVSWYLDKHVVMGKEELNFSEFTGMTSLEQISVLNGICEVLESGTMPLKSYSVIHREARIGEQERLLLCEWAEMQAEGLIRKR